MQRALLAIMFLFISSGASFAGDTRAFWTEAPTANLTTSINVFNYGSATQTVTATFYNNLGSSHGSVTKVLAANNRWSVTTGNTGSSSLNVLLERGGSGSVKITSSSSTQEFGAYATIYQTQNISGFNYTLPEGEATGDTRAFWTEAPSASLTTSVNAINYNTATVTVTATFYNNSGTELGEAISTTLAPNAKWSFGTSDTGNSTLDSALSATASGSVEITSPTTQDFGAYATVYQTQNISGFNYSLAERDAAGDTRAFWTEASSAGITTAVNAINYGFSTVTATMTFYDNSGTSLGSRNDYISPGEKWSVATNDTGSSVLNASLASAVTGSVKVSASSDTQDFGVYATVYKPSTISGFNFKLPESRRTGDTASFWTEVSSASLTTAINAVNLDTSTVTVTATFYNNTGTSLGSATSALAPDGRWNFLTRNTGDTALDNALAGGATGSVRFTGSGTQHFGAYATVYQTLNISGFNFSLYAGAQNVNEALVNYNKAVESLVTANNTYVQKIQELNAANTSSMTVAQIETLIDEMITAGEQTLRAMQNYNATLADNDTFKPAKPDVGTGDSGATTSEIVSLIPGAENGISSTLTSAIEENIKNAREESATLKDLRTRNLISDDQYRAASQKLADRQHNDNVWWAGFWYGRVAGAVVGGLGLAAGVSGAVVVVPAVIIGAAAHATIYWAFSNDTCTSGSSCGMATGKVDEDNPAIVVPAGTKGNLSITGEGIAPIVKSGYTTPSAGDQATVSATPVDLDTVTGSSTATASTETTTLTDTGSCSDITTVHTSHAAFSGTASETITFTVTVSPPVSGCSVSKTQTVVTKAGTSASSRTGSSTTLTTGSSGTASFSVTGADYGIMHVSVSTTANSKTFDNTFSFDYGDPTVGSLAISPSTASINLAETLDLDSIATTATYADSTTEVLTSGLTWSVYSGSGTVSGSTFTPPFSSGTTILKVYASGASTKVAYLTVTITNPLSRITVYPSTASITTAETLSLSSITVRAIYYDSSSSTLTSGVTWSVYSGGGSISSSTYTPSADGTVVLRASYTESGVTKTADVTVTVTTGLTLSSIAISPTSGTMTTNQTATLSSIPVTATYSDSSTATVTSSATWSVYSGSGSISGTTYTPSSSGGTVVLMASYTEGGVTKTAYLTITVSAYALSSISISTSSTTIATSQTVTLSAIPVTATYTDASTATVTSSATWRISSGSGSISNTPAGSTVDGSSTSTFTAPSTAGSSVLTVSYTEGGVTKTTTYTVTYTSSSTDTGGTSSGTWQSSCILTYGGSLLTCSNYEVPVSEISCSGTARSSECSTTGATGRCAVDGGEVYYYVAVSSLTESSCVNDSGGTWTYY